MVAGILTGAVAAAVLAAGGTVGAGGGAADTYWIRAEATFAPPTAFVPSPAVTYDMGLVPAASWIEVVQYGGERGTDVAVRVRGMRPGHAYGVHVHQKPCGAAPEAAGGHYQHRVDPVQPSKDPAYLNPENEIWLDLTAGADGSGWARAHHDWGFRPGGAASVVLHREQGGAGDRVACFTVPFGSPSADAPPPAD
ncbi:superoxide dismutase family protein [Streptomyces luteocolor]|uniref:superoxide dismutase family protein n=1 Tax=Streptomyces luteocolor TaxID=285500 RepID=UPI00085362D6|nr:superoxide dismutase family protein [Streptomyces luteocolor]